MNEEFLKSYFKIEKKISYKNKNAEIKKRIKNSYIIEEFLKSYFKIEKKISYKNKNGEIKERILNSYIIKDNKKIPYLSRKDTMDKFKKSQILLSLPDKILFNLIKEINNEYSNSEIINKLSENQMNIMYMHNCFLSINDNWINELENKVNDNIDKYIL
jgi:hypothetical protein